MAKRTHKNRLMIDYSGLGTVCVEEFTQALIEDMHAIREDFRIRFCTRPRLYLPVTNEYGDPVDIRRDDGMRVERIHTYHYRPFCLEFER